VANYSRILTIEQAATIDLGDISTEILYGFQHIATGIFQVKLYSYDDPNLFQEATRIYFKDGLTWDFIEFLLKRRDKDIVELEKCYRHEIKDSDDNLIGQLVRNFIDVKGV